MNENGVDVVELEGHGHLVEGEGGVGRLRVVGVVARGRDFEQLNAGDPWNGHRPHNVVRRRNLEIAKLRRETDRLTRELHVRTYFVALLCVLKLLVLAGATLLTKTSLLLSQSLTIETCEVVEAVYRRSADDL